MISKATGTFSVKLELQTPSPQADSAVIGRRSIEKIFHGDLEATSTGEMLSVMTDVDGSMAYVALEKLNGTVAGKQGGFVLQHASQMVRGQAFQSIRVVPDSATGDLVGLDGEMRIDVRDGEHFYVFEYSLSEQS